jgi:3D (Asp-Asp-Asp) domain-containing protein/uncharacterized protein YabE (DUF348 family)
MKKYFYALAGLLVVFAVFITTADAMEGGSNRVTIEFVDESTTMTVFTQTPTVGELLENLQISLHEMDSVTPDVNMGIYGSMEIVIERAFPVYLRLDGAEEPVVAFARPGSFLLTFVNDLRSQTGLDYVFDRENWQKRLEPGDIVELATVRRVVYENFEEIPYETVYAYNDELLKNERRINQPGMPGRRQINTLVVYIGGESYSRTIVSDEILWHPVNARAQIGTYLPPNHAVSACGELFTYTRSFLAEATAYTLDFASTGRHPGDPLFGVTASGMQARVGVVAVDTNVIPFHTRLYIEGYGFAVAGDRGGAIRGEKVDLFFDTREETIQFGRRHINVWILDEIE